MSFTFSRECLLGILLNNACNAVAVGGHHPWKCGATVLSDLTTGYYLSLECWNCKSDAISVCLASVCGVNFKPGAPN